MKYFLIETNFDWADEINFPSGCVIPEDEWEEVKKEIKNFKYPFEIYVGTNEEIEFRNSDEILNECEISEISENEYNIVSSLVGYDWGNLSIAEIYNFYTSNVEEYEEEDEWEEYVDDQPDFQNDDDF